MMKTTPTKANGFTIIESLVAISILVVVIVGVTGAIQTGISSYIFSKDQVIAFYLAQEGFEQIRNIRDENSLKNLNWLAGVAEVSSDPCYFGSACIVDTVGSVVPTRCSAGPGSCPVLRQDATTGFFGYNMSWPESIFTREIQLTQVNADEISILVSVKWSKGIVNREFRAKENILNWQSAQIATYSTPAYGYPAPTPSTLDVDYLVVAGGGGGGMNHPLPCAAGSGGAGGLLTGSSSLTIGNLFTVIVGGGGTGQNAYDGYGGLSGGNSSALGFSAIGGGGGGGATDAGPSLVQHTGIGGGSGGGGSCSASGGSRVAGQGNIGGSNAGGGGGAGAAGGNGGSGGAGLTVFGSTYATGGSVNGGSGAANTGNGGGGAGDIGAYTNGGNGGSGIVIIRYANTNPDATATGSYTSSNAGGYKIYRFTGNGTFTPQ